MEALVTRGLEAQKALSEWIDDHGIKQAAIAKALGIRPHRIHEIMRLKTQMKATEFIMICDFIDKNPNDFIQKNREE